MGQWPALWAALLQFGRGSRGEMPADGPTRPRQADGGLDIVIPPAVSITCNRAKCLYRRLLEAAREREPPTSFPTENNMEANKAPATQGAWETGAAHTLAAGLGLAWGLARAGQCPMAAVHLKPQPPRPRV